MKLMLNFVYIKLFLDSYMFKITWLWPFWYLRLSNYPYGFYQVSR